MKHFISRLTLLALFLSFAGWANAQCAAGFSAAPVGGTTTVDFTNTSMGVPPFFGGISTWSFGDGSSATVGGLAPVSHTYPAPGVYIVCLTISDTIGGGCSSTFCDSVLVGGGGGGPWCSPNFSYSVSTCDVDFSDLSTASGAIVAHVWDFGDGGSATSASPSHTYAGAGPWTVSLTIYTADSCSNTYTTTVSTPSCGSSPCSASYWWMHDSTGAYTILLFPTYSGSPATTTYLWTFGDGSSSTSAYPSHVYAGVGTYVVCVTITDGAFGCSSTYCDSIAVTYKTAVPFSINVVDITTEVKKPVLGQDLNVFPNPFSNTLNLSLSLNEGCNVSVDLVDIAGRVVSSSNASSLSAGSHSLSLSTTDVAPGIYLVRVKAGDQTYTRKVVAH